MSMAMSWLTHVTFRALHRELHPRQQKRERSYIAVLVCSTAFPRLHKSKRQPTSCRLEIALPRALGNACRRRLPLHLG